MKCEKCGVEFPHKKGRYCGTCNWNSPTFKMAEAARKRRNNMRPSISEFLGPNHEEQIKTLNEALAKTQTALHVSESQRTDKWIETGLMSELKRNDLLRAENEQLKRDYESLKEENSVLRGVNQSLSVDWVKFDDMRDALERIVKWYENEEDGVYASSVARRALRRRNSMSQGTFEWDNQTKEELKQRDDRFQNSIDDAYLSSHQQPCDCEVSIQ